MPKDNISKVINSGSIAHKLVKILVAIGILITLATSLLQVYREYRLGLNQIHKQFERIDKEHSQSLASSLWNFSKNQIEIELKGLSNGPDIEYVELKANSGESWVAGKRKSAKGFTKELPLTFSRGDTIIPIGTLSIFAGFDGLYARIKAQALGNLFNAAVWTFFMGGTIFLFFRYFVTRHLYDLSRYTSELQLGTLAEPLVLDRPLGKPDELDLVVNAINSMQTQLATSALQLQANEKRFREFVEGTDNLITQIDKHGNFTYVNHVAQDIFGFPPEDCIGQSAFLFIEAKDAERTRKWFDACRRDRTLSATFENRLISRSGGVRDMIWTVNFQYDQHGQVEHINSIGRDLTEIKEAEIEKNKLENQLQQTQKIESIGQLAGGVAHDFNNMLGVIFGHTELALMKADPSTPVVEDLKAIRTAAKRSADLTRQLLAFARKQAIAPIVLDLNETVAGMLNMLQRLIGENIHLSWVPEVNHCFVKIDPSQLNQILANLCVNARDAIAGIGEITIEIQNCCFTESDQKSHPESQPGDYVRLSVADDGHGIDKENLNQIFEPFFTTKALGQGTGLGLSTVYGAVKQNSGFIEVSCNPGQGTTFQIYFPRKQGSVDALEETAAPPSASRDRDRSTG